MNFLLSWFSTAWRTPRETALFKTSSTLNFFFFREVFFLIFWRRFVEILHALLLHDEFSIHPIFYCSIHLIHRNCWQYEAARKDIPPSRNLLVHKSTLPIAFLVRFSSTYLHAGLRSFIHVEVRGEWNRTPIGGFKSHVHVLRWENGVLVHIFDCPNANRG